MVFRGHTRNGVIVPDGDLALPDGRAVEVVLIDRAAGAGPGEVSESGASTPTSFKEFLLAGPSFEGVDLVRDSGAGRALEPGL